MVRIRAAAAPTLIRFSLVVAVAVTVAACSSTTTPSALVGSGSSSTSSDPAHGSGGSGSSPGGATSSGDRGSGQTGGSPGRKTRTGSTVGGSSVSGAGGAPSKRASKAKVKSTKAGHSPTTTGIPPVPNQFEVNDASFESTLDHAQTTLSHFSPGVTANQVTKAMQPLVAAAGQYQSEIVYLQWPGQAKSSTQSVSENHCLDWLSMRYAPPISVRA